MTLQLPTAEDDSDRKLLADIDRIGWHVVGIEEDDEGPPYAFSVGLFHTFEHPEIIIFGLNHEVAANLINNIGEQIRNGVRYIEGEESEHIVEGYAVAFRHVPKTSYRQLVGYARWFYRSDDFPALQCIWPDPAGRFPWQEGYDHGFLSRQPLLEKVDWSSDDGTNRLKLT